MTERKGGHKAPITLKEAAEILGTSPDNLRGAIARGALKATKLGRDWFVQPKEVERYGRENRRYAGLAITPRNPYGLPQSPEPPRRLPKVHG